MFEPIVTYWHELDVIRVGISEEAAVDDAFTSEMCDIRNSKKRYTVCSKREMWRKRYSNGDTHRQPPPAREGTHVRLNVMCHKAHDTGLGTCPGSRHLQLSGSPAVLVHSHGQGPSSTATHAAQVPSLRKVCCQPSSSCDFPLGPWDRWRTLRAQGYDKGGTKAIGFEPLGAVATSTSTLRAS